jgi:hypothetical protein
MLGLKMMIFGKKKHDDKQRTIGWYYFEKKQMLDRLKNTDIPPGHYAVVKVNTDPFATDYPDKIEVVQTYIEAIAAIKKTNDYFTQQGIPYPETQISILDSHKQIICWINCSADAQPFVPDIDAVLGKKPDDADIMDKVMHKSN